MRIIWCEVHLLSGVVPLFLEEEPHCPVAWRGKSDYPCRMVPMLLVPIDDDPDPNQLEVPFKNEQGAW